MVYKMTLQTAQALDESFQTGMAPDPRLTFAEWADRHFLLPPGSAIKGKIQMDRTPYLIKLLECLSWTSPLRKVVFVKGTQIGATLTSDIIIQATVDLYPVPILMIFGSEDMAVEHVKTRIEPALEDNPRLVGKVRDTMDKRGKSTRKLKVFPGGSLKFAGGATGKSYRTYSAGIVIADDVDTLLEDIGGTASKTGEGSPLELLKNRTDARDGKYKLYYSGTPTISGSSLIWGEFELTDQNYFYVPCPECGEMQVLDFFRIKFDRTDDYLLDSEPYYECVNDDCKRHVEEWEKIIIMQDGEWRPTGVSQDPDAIGFSLSSAYSTLGYTWADMAKGWLKAIKDKRQGDLRGLTHFYNTRLGLAWDQDPGEKIEHSELYARREDYKQIPKEAIIITAGADVQKQRIEVTVVAYGENQERWFIEHKIIGGDPWIPYGSEGSPWDDLETFMATTYPNEYGGRQPILATSVDLGYCSLNASPFIKTLQGTGVEIYGMIGKAGRSRNFINPPNTNKYGIDAWAINVDVGKMLTHNQLKTEDRMIHFSKHASFTENFFHQLTIERLKEKTIDGKATQYWYCPPHAANEATDTTNYSLAAFHIYGQGGLDFEDHREWNERGCPTDGGTGGATITVLDEGISL